MMENTLVKNYKPLYESRHFITHPDHGSEQTCACNDCWYSWGWVVAFYTSERDSKRTLEEFKSDVLSNLSTNTPWHNAYERGIEDGWHARLESQEAGIIHT